MKSRITSTKLERKTIEKNRRTQMKNLCFKLSSLIPYQHHPKDTISQLDQVDLAAGYIKTLKEKVEELKQKRDLVKHIIGNNDMRNEMMIGIGLPLLEVRDLGSTLEVFLISGLKRNFMMCDVISVLEEEGADVMSASFSFMADKVIHIIHSQVASSRVGFESGRVYERLKKLVH